MDILSTDPCPGTSFQNLPHLAWHTVSAASEMKLHQDLIVTTHHCDWVCELPPGAVLAPLCLFHIAHTANTAFNLPAAIFTDDDLITADGVRRRPRLKPDIDPEWIRCTDL